MEAELYLAAEQYPSPNMRRFDFLRYYYFILRFFADCYFAVVDAVFELFNAFQPVEHISWTNASSLLFIPSLEAAAMIRRGNVKIEKFLILD